MSSTGRRRAPHLPGFGSSFKNPELEYNFQTYARWMEEFMVAIKSGPVHLIGNSLGGAMAMKGGAEAAAGYGAARSKATFNAAGDSAKGAQAKGGNGKG